jgi:hypothetical protein
VNGESEESLEDKGCEMEPYIENEINKDSQSLVSEFEEFNESIKMSMLKEDRI